MIGAAGGLLVRACGGHTHNRFGEIRRAGWEGYRGQRTLFEMERYLPVL